MHLTCEITVNDRYSVRLTARRSSLEADLWDWACVLQDGRIIAAGKTHTRVAAQVAGQRVYEAWLHRHRYELHFPSRIGYLWNEVE
jgi:hypothetical protein